MKTLFTFVFLIVSSLATFAQNQPIEVFLIGTSHNYITKLEKFDSVITKVVAYKPELIFSETLTPEDYKALDRHWNQKNIDKMMNYLQKVGYPAPKNVDSFIKKQYALLAKNPNYHQERMKLAHALLKQNDFGNASYQIFLIHQAKPVLGREELDACTRILGPIDSLKNLGLRLNSEYSTIFYPAAKSLGIYKMTPMDCQKYNTSWEAAWENADSLFRKFEKVLDKMDSTSAEVKAYTALMNRYKALEKQEYNFGKEGRITYYFNTPDGDENLNISNFYGGTRLFGVNGYPKEAVSDMLNYWRMRNEGMCQNIVSRARAAGAKRVVVAVGANHRRIMLDILAQMPNVTIKTLNNQ